MEENLCLVMGLGNPLLSDDASGLLLIERAEKSWQKKTPKVDFRTSFSAGFDLLLDLCGYRFALLVDSVFTGTRQPGFCHEFRPEDFSRLAHSRLVSSHGLNLPSLLTFGNNLGLSLPLEIVIFGIEGRDFFTFSEKPSRAIERSFSHVVQKIFRKIETWTFIQGGSDE